MVTWEWDTHADVIRYSDNVTDIAAGKAIDSYVSAASLLQMLHPDDRDRVSKAFDRTVKEGTLFDCEYRVLMQDGAYHWIHGKGKIAFVKKGRPVRILGISQDITARKRMEEELQTRSHQLAELTARLTLTEHRERQRLADLLHEDLQQILIGARMRLGIIEGRERGRRKTELARVDQVLSQAQNVARSVLKTLVPPLSLRGDLPLALQWLANDMRERHDLQVDVRAPETVGTLPEATAVLVYSGAREMLLNIVKHAGTRRGRLRLRRKATAVELEVRDDGSGIRKAALQGPGADHGLGLFSIRERAELLGGTLMVDTTCRHGARFVLSLPVPEDRPKRRPPARPPRAS